MTPKQSQLAALGVELDLHAEWFGTEYPADVVPEGADWDRLTRMVYQVEDLVTVNVIGNCDLYGAELVAAAVDYHQAVLSFNQLVEQAMRFQANPELWVDDPDLKVVERMRNLTAKVHWKGIGTAESDAAHAKHKALKAAWHAELLSTLPA